MGNGIFNCKGCSEYCVGRTHVEINNNLYSNYNEMKLDKSKSDQRIITNIFIPNCKLEFSPDNSNINQKIQLPQIINNQSKIEINNLDNNNKENGDSQNNFTQFLNEIKNEKNIGFNSPSLTLTIINNQSHNKDSFDSYNIEMFNFLNKMRNTPQLIIEDIDNIIKNNIKLIDDKEYIISDNTNEMIKLNINLEKIKDNLILEEPVKFLKLNNKLKINHYFENILITDKIINELIISKKREIINEFKDCFFYPFFIKDIKINFILLLDNNKIKDKIFNNNFNYCYVTTFNEKKNRFFGILCLA